MSDPHHGGYSGPFLLEPPTLRTETGQEKISRVRMFFRPSISTIITRDGYTLAQRDKSP